MVGEDGGGLVVMLAVVARREREVVCVAGIVDTCCGGLVRGLGVDGSGLFGELALDMRVNCARVSGT